MRRGRRQRREDERRVAAERRDDRGPAAAERHMGDVDAEGERKQLAREMRGRADAGRTVAEFSRIGLRQRDERLQGVRRNRRMHREHVRRGAQQAHRREIPDRIVGDLGVQRRVDDEAAPRGQDGVAVARRARRGAHADIAAGAREGFHVELLFEILRKFLRHQARRGVRLSARADRHDHAHRPRRISLCPGCASEKRQRRGATGEAQHVAAKDDHGAALTPAPPRA